MLFKVYDLLDYLNFHIENIRKSAAIFVRFSLKKNSYLLGMLFLFSSTIYAENEFGSSKSLSTAMLLNADIKYTEAFPESPFEYTKLAVTDNHYLHPYRGTFEKTFVLTIPQEQVFGVDGWVVANGSLINELIWQNVFPDRRLLQKIKTIHPNVIAGRLAIIAQSGYTYYYHWIAEVLGRLALLEMLEIDYDYLYVPTNRPYMRETLSLWGVPSSKIIEASDDAIYAANELIVPSLVAKVKTDGCPRLVHYLPKNILYYIKNKLLTAVTNHPEKKHFSKKVFLSRKDSSARKMLNEDDVFAIFETKGFKRYTLSEMSIIDQILLFNQADVVVGALGSNLTNVIFCNPQAHIIDIFQARRDCTIYYLCQNLGLKYQCVKTTEFIDQYDGQYDTLVPLDIIQNLVENL